MRYRASAAGDAAGEPDLDQVLEHARVLAFRGDPVGRHLVDEDGVEADRPSCRGHLIGVVAQEGLAEVAEYGGAGLDPGLIILPQGRADQQRAWLNAVIDFIEAHAVEDGEEPWAWMICRIVIYDDSDDSISWEWTPDPPR
jgi:hypothetical protein